MILGVQRYENVLKNNFYTLKSIGGLNMYFYFEIQVHQIYFLISDPNVSKKED